MKTKSDFTKDVDNFINKLSERQKNVIKRRFGLDDGKRMTLESIGKQQGLTRERIRQIIEGAFRDFEEYLSEMESLIQKIKSKLESFGSICREDKFLEESLNSLVGDKNNLSKKQLEKSKNYIIFLLSLFPYFNYVFEKPKNHSVWYMDQEALNKVNSVHNFFRQELEKLNRPLSYEEYKELVKKAVQDKNLPVFDEDKLLSYLDISKEFKFNPLSEFGLSKWSLINLSSVNDKAYLILKKKEKPMHFSEITNEINKIGFNRYAKTTTVHNQLIQDSRFVLYSRGTYVLQEWGYCPGSLKDVMIKILESGAKTKEKLVEEVKKQRDVKEATVLLHLKNENLFKQLPDNRWCLGG